MKLKQYRQSQGQSQYDLARLLGTSAASISRYENGRIPEPEIMARIVEATGGTVTPNDFYDLPDDPSEAA